EAAGRAVLAMTGCADLSLCEIMDRTTIAAVDKLTNMGLDLSAEAFVLVQSDASDAAAAIELCAAACHELGAHDVMATDDRGEGDQLLAARRAALPALERMGRTLLDDVCVPIARLPALLARIPMIAARHEVVVGTFGHAGDGNLHPTIVFDHGDDRAAANAMAAFGDIVHAALELGGTITGEHGIGSLKVPYLGQQLGINERALLARIKAAFDPQGILNPGKAL
ncbi:MAG TPA: FAD-linked oxidase C-terminal domain-containing protein, partial [Kofleriaceae bacterium]